MLMWKMTLLSLISFPSQMIIVRLLDSICPDKPYKYPLIGPPGCPTVKFNEIIENTDKQKNELEKWNINPIIYLDGDLNFPL